MKPQIMVVRRVRTIVEYKNVRVETKGHESLEEMKAFACETGKVHPSLGVAIQQDHSKWEITSISSQQTIATTFEADV